MTKKKPRFLASQKPSLLLHSKSLQQNYHRSFRNFKPKSVLYRLMRLRWLVKTLAMDIILRLKVTIKMETTKNPCFGSSSRFVSCALILTLRNTYIYVFRAFLAHLLWFLEAKYKIVTSYAKFRAKRASINGVSMH